MRQIGVRELKQSLSETLREVAAGQQVRVTVRGRAVADIVPARGSSEPDRLRELVALGRLRPPSRDRPSRPPRLARGRRAASAVVIADRDEER
jgi:prevent-host-death family protein